jgi:hypothetical protein
MYLEMNEKFSTFIRDMSLPTANNALAQKKKIPLSNSFCEDLPCSATIDLTSQVRQILQ